MNEAELIAEAGKLGSIPEQAARDYRSKIITMIEEVDERILDRADVDRITGGNPVSVIRNNHENHAHFITNVLLFDDFTLLVRTLPWVYRAYRSRGFSDDYFPSVVSAYKEAVERHLGGSTAPVVSSIYQWMMDHHDAVLELSSRIDEHASAPDPGTEDLVDHLVAGDSPYCIEHAQEAVRGPEDLAGYYVDRLQPAMYEVGRRWETGRISVAEEHLATSVAHRLVSALYAQNMPRRAQGKHSAIVSSVVNEFHDLGARLVADLMEIQGFRVIFLGANTPVESLVSMTSEFRPDVLMLSVSLPFNLERTRLVTEAIGEKEHLAHTRVMVGGQAFHWSDDLHRKVGAHGWAPDGRRAVELATSWTATSRRRS